MEIVIGVGFEGKELCAYALTRDGERTDFPVTELHRRGLLTTARKDVRRFTTCFNDWRETDPHEYLQAFGFQNAASVAFNHRFFEFQVYAVRYVVPALLLIRGFFRPSRFLLPAIFRPHAIEQISRVELLPSGETVHTVDASWATAGRTKNYSDWNIVLAWLNTHPSAKEMAASVHRNALSGVVSIELPNATAQVTCRGVRVGNSVFVSDLTLMTVEPHDLPEFPIANSVTLLTLHRGASSTGEGRFAPVADIVVPARHDGQTDLTDSEWEHVEPVLMSSRKCKQPFTHSPRALLDGILGKLSSGTPWRLAHYKVGTHQNAVTACRDWTGRGVLANVLSILEETRRAP